MEKSSRLMKRKLRQLETDVRRIQINAAGENPDGLPSLTGGEKHHIVVPVSIQLAELKLHAYTEDSLFRL